MFAPPDTPTERPELWSGVAGGGPANVSAALAQLGTGSAFIGIIGDDEGGQRLKRVLIENHVNVDGVQEAKGHGTRTVFVRVGDDGERDFVGFGGDNRSFADTQQIDGDNLPGVLFYAAKMLMLPTLGLAFDGCAKSFDMLLDMAKTCMLETVVDINWRPVFWSHYSNEEARKRILDIIYKVDLLKISCEEISFIFGDELATQALTDPQSVLQKVQNKGVLITDGRNGSAYAFNYGQLVTGRAQAVAPASGVVDTTGAGDSFLAGFLSEMMRLGGTPALADAKKVKEMIEFAAATASFVIAREGVFSSLPTRKEVEQLVMKL
ncbi:pfkB family carbohydrate kinase [Gracilaria domingensis]|nr:pfkB family carbohydrate kinase [Gracilaria domingensis]